MSSTGLIQNDSKAAPEARVDINASLPSSRRESDQPHDQCSVSSEPSLNLPYKSKADLLESTDERFQSQSEFSEDEKAEKELEIDSWQV